MLIGMNRYGHLMTVLDSSFCTVETCEGCGFGNFFHLLCHNVYAKSMKRPVLNMLKPNLVVEIEIIPWCLTKCFANPELYIST